MVKPRYAWVEYERVSDTQTRLTFGVMSGNKASVIIEDAWVESQSVCKIGNYLVGRMEMAQTMMRYLHDAKP